EAASLAAEDADHGGRRRWDVQARCSRRNREDSPWSMIFITGASSGIGESCARKFAEARRGLVLAARRKERVEKLARELKEKHGVETHAFQLDVRSRSAVESF